MNLRIHTLLAVLISSLVFPSCTWLDTAPEDLVLADDALETEEDLQALLVSCYDVLANIYDGDVQLINELRGDHTAEPRSDGRLQAIHARETIRWNSYVGGMNREFFFPVLRVNALFDAFNFVPGIAAETQNRMRAEGSFIRAFCLWGAVKIWAQPYGFTADNSHLGIPLPIEFGDNTYPRATVAEAYAQIESDLAVAIEFLPEENGVFATKDAAKALLAQIKFLQLDFEGAVALATDVIASGRYALEAPSSPEEFLRLRLPIGSTSTETIFGTFSNPDISDNRADKFSDWWRPTTNPEITLDPALYQWYTQIATGSSEDGRMVWLENRPAEGQLWLKRFSEHDYFNVPLIHLTQMMLIRAEAYGELGSNLATAIDDINAIRTRAGIVSDVYLLDATATAEDVIEAARMEYRKETLGMGLWVEQLQRRGTMGEDITIRNAPWDCDGMALQFSASEGNVEGFTFNPVGGCN